ncbi:MAG: Asp-tRNA(Asn)/Glu-tRNA(Gln) amidotransferase subunit GatA [Anaerolineae bacterium]
MELSGFTLLEARRRLRCGDVSAVELTQAVLTRIVEQDNWVRAYLTLTPEMALEQAREADACLALCRRDNAEPPALTGLPLAIKDVLCTAGIATTCGSRMLEDFIPPYDATVVARVRQAGAVVLGKTNTDEFAMGSSTENSAYFPTHNPWDLSRVPGGSSGGSAAAVAAGEALGALGSDTGGSVRQPAAFCGIVGLKPTYGRVSRYGLVAFASSLDQVGTLTRDVADAALLLGVIAGADAHDSTCVALPVPDYLASLEGDLQGVCLGVPDEFFGRGMEAEVETVVRRALQDLETLGARLERVSLPHTEYALPVYYLLAPAEASSNLARYDGVKYGYAAPEARDLWDHYKRTRERGFGAEVKRRIMLGTYALSAGYYDAYYLKAQKVRTLIREDFERALQRVDAIVAPTSPTVAFPIGARIDDPLQMYLSDVYTLSLNLAGLCGLSVPCGFAGGMPVGLQIMGRAFDEAGILRIARAYEQATPWHTQRPTLARDTKDKPINDGSEKQRRCP